MLRCRLGWCACVSSGLSFADKRPSRRWQFLHQVVQQLGYARFISCFISITRESPHNLYQCPNRTPGPGPGTCDPTARAVRQALQAPNVASRCQLIPRKDVQMGVKLKHSQSQACWVPPAAGCVCVCVGSVFEDRGPCMPWV